jgi:hypothetical protein
MDFNKIHYEELYGFLESNKHFNKKIQHYHYRSILNPAFSNFEKLKALLRSNVMTQLQPNLDKLRCFWQKVDKHRGELENIGDIDGFIEVLNKFSDSNAGGEDNLWSVMQRLPGWGDKTAALFVKSLVNIHLYENKNIWFLDENENENEKEKIPTDIYLPVDRVITHIFENLPLLSTAAKSFEPSRKNAGIHFANINMALRNRYTASEMLVWDDLWFWGFITQQNSGKTRITKFNDSKLWSLKAMDGAFAKRVEPIAHQFGEMVDRKYQR